MKKFEPQKYALCIQHVGDHLAVYIPELNITVETEPGKLAHQDALDAVHLAVEQRLLQEEEPAKTAVE